MTNEDGLEISIRNYKEHGFYDLKFCVYSRGKHGELHCETHEFKNTGHIQLTGKIHLEK